METNRTGYAEYLEHHGVKGQRWGIRRTPEQLGHRRKRDATSYGSASSKKGKPSVSKSLANRREVAAKERAAKKEAALKRKVEQRAKKLQRKQEQKEKKKAKKEAITKEKAAKKAQEDIARREKILQDPTLLYKHRKEFSPDEIKKAMTNIKMEQELQDLSMKRLGIGQQYIDTAVKYAETGIKAYNKAASIYNAFNQDKDDLPIIQSGGGNKKKKKKDQKDDDD